MQHIFLIAAVFIAALTSSAVAKPPLTDGENAHNLGCSFYEFVELEIKGERFHCPQYAPPEDDSSNYWGDDYSYDNPFMTDDFDQSCDEWSDDAPASGPNEWSQNPFVNVCAN